MRNITDGLVMVTCSWFLEKATQHSKDMVVPDRYSVLQMICRKENKTWKISFVHKTEISKVYQGMVNTKLHFHSDYS